MALWQITFIMLPKEAWKMNPPPQGTHISEFDETGYWARWDHGLDSFFIVERLLPKRKSWAAYIELYGHQDSNLMEVTMENGGIESVSFRIDYTTDYEPIVRCLIEFALMNSLVILDVWLEEMPFLFESFRSYIEDTDQYKLYHKMIEDKHP